MKKWFEGITRNKYVARIARNKWIARFGALGLLFFLAKGLAWLTVAFFAVKSCQE